MNEQQLQQFSTHCVNWALVGISKTLQAMGQIQVNTDLSEEEKKQQIALNSGLLLNLFHIIVPYYELAEQLFPEHKLLLEWIKKGYEDALEKKIIQTCSCKACSQK